MTKDIGKWKVKSLDLEARKRVGSGNELFVISNLALQKV